MLPSLIAVLLLSSPFATEFAHAGGISVRARKGGVALQLETSRHTVRAGEPLFVRLTLRNVATKGEMAVSDWKYRGGNAAELESEWMAAAEGLGIDTIEVVGPNGKPLAPQRYERSNIKQSVAPWEVVVTSSDAETERYVKSLREAGLQGDEIEKLLDKRQRQLEESERDRRHPVVFLAPGDAVRSASFCTRDSCPEEGFVELPFVFSPGRYRVRAVYSHAPEKGRPESEWEVDLKTRWMTFEVLP